MEKIKTTINSNLLYIKGILLESGEICQDKINLISGAVIAPFVENIWTFLEHDINMVERIYSVFRHKYQAGHEIEMMAVLRILYDVFGLQFPEEIELLMGQPEARQYFLFSFLLDFEDYIHDLIP